jgi:hypothetical protein
VDQGKEIWHLAGESATTGRLAICNIFFEADQDRGWAIETWKSLDFRPESDP